MHVTHDALRLAVQPSLREAYIYEANLYETKMKFQAKYDALRLSGDFSAFPHVYFCSGLPYLLNLYG